MAAAESNSDDDRPFEAPRSAVEIFFDSATEALGSAFMLWMLGGVAISIAGSFAGKMVPSLPPGFDGPQAGHHHVWWNSARGGAFVLFFAIFFMHSLWAGFHARGGGAGRRMERILSNLRENWFGLIVGNAIGAWVAVLVLGAVPSFNPVRMLLHPLWETVLPVVRKVSASVFGESNTANLADWFSWYEANQLKLDFWIIYLAGAFDDLGVPNYKTLARWAWRRWQKRKDTTLPGSVDRGEVV